MAQLVRLRVKGELLGPASKGTISLTCYILLWLQFHLVAVGCEEWFHISIMVEGFALMKRIMDLFQGHFHMSKSFFLIFLLAQGRPQNLQLFKALQLGWGFFPPVLFSLQMTCHEEEIKRKTTVIVWIILYHPQKGNQGLGWIKKAMQIDWCWLEVNTSKSIP